MCNVRKEEDVQCMCEGKEGEGCVEREDEEGCCVVWEWKKEKDVQCEDDVGGGRRRRMCRV